MEIAKGRIKETHYDEMLKKHNEELDLLENLRRGFESKHESTTKEEKCS